MHGLRPDEIRRVASRRRGETSIKRTIHASTRCGNICRTARHRCFPLRNPADSVWRSLNPVCRRGREISLKQRRSKQKGSSLGLWQANGRTAYANAAITAAASTYLLDKLRSSYRYGTFCCRRHQSLASASKCTREKRRLCESKLIDLAAGQLLRRKISRPDWQLDKSRKVQLAADVCKAIFDGKDRHLKVGRPVVTLNWITRNQRGIEQKRRDFVEARPT